MPTACQVALRLGSWALIGGPLCPPAVEYSPFYGIEKGLVLQETRVFNEAHVDPRRCQQVITKLLYLLTQGETFTKVSDCRVEPTGAAATVAV